MAQQVKDVVLLQLWHRFSPWPGNFHMLQMQTKKKKNFIHAHINFKHDYYVPAQC